MMGGMDDGEEDLNPEEADYQNYQNRMNETANMEAQQKATSDQQLLSLEKLTSLISTDQRPLEEMKLEFTDIQL